VDGPRVLGRIEQALQPLGVQRVTLDGRLALVASMSQFRWRWAATKLTTFVIVSLFTEASPGRVELDRFLDAGIQGAIQHKGGMPRGLQTGCAAIVAAVAERPGEAALDWASKVHGRRFAAIPFPAIVDLSTAQVHRPRRMVLGGIYGPHLKRTVDELIAAPVRAELGG
jgi:hypothetical protein